MRYIPRLDCITPGWSASSVYTIGKVTKAPPSFSQQCTCGKSDIFIFSNECDETFLGNALIAENATPKYFNGFFNACIGLVFNAIIVFTFSMESLNKNLLLSVVPNKLETA